MERVFAIAVPLKNASSFGRRMTGTFILYDNSPRLVYDNMDEHVEHVDSIL